MASRTRCIAQHSAPDAALVSARRVGRKEKPLPCDPGLECTEDYAGFARRGQRFGVHLADFIQTFRRKNPAFHRNRTRRGARLRRDDCERHAFSMRTRQSRGNFGFVLWAEQPTRTSRELTRVAQIAPDDLGVVASDGARAHLTARGHKLGARH